MIVSWPKGIRARGELRHSVSHFIDIVPTILDLAGVEQAVHADRPRLPGKSLVPVFGEDPDWPERPFFFFHTENQALRLGDWKAVMRRDNGDRWELYNIGNDRAELEDLADHDPDKLSSLVSIWKDLEAQFDEDFQSGAVSGR